MSNATLDTSQITDKDSYATDAERWDAFNKHWEDQIRGKGLKFYEEHCMAKLRACIVGDPFSVYIPNLTAEMDNMIKDNTTEEFKQYWRDNGNKLIRDVEPELYDQMVEAVADRDEKYEKAGVTIIKNRIGWYPDPVINFNDCFDGPKYLSIYNGAVWKMAGNNVLLGQTCGPVKQSEIAIRPATLALAEESPGTKLVGFPIHEPNPNVKGPGIAGLDSASFRQMPGKTILFGYGVTSADQIEEAKRTGKGTVAGWPRGENLFMRLLNELGYTSETWWFDSRLSYHEDCVMMNIVEGVIGLPDDGKNGMWTDLPDCIKDWEIFPIPVEDIKRGAANSTTLGDGRIFINSKCTKTIDLLEKKGYEPIPVKYDILWETFNSGMDCSDANIWREND